MKNNPITPAILMVCTLLISSFSFSQKSRIVSYVEQYKSLAIEEMVRTGIPASITLAQGLLETGFGESKLAINANNHFGIKCKGDWTGERVYHDDDTKGECFRKYNSPIESYRDHSDFLRNRPHYASLFKLDITDYEGWAKGLKAAGYATNPQYPKLLIKLIEENNLHQYTLLALQQKEQSNSQVVAAKQATPEIETAGTEVIAVAEHQVTDANKTTPEPELTVPALPAEEVNNYPAGIFTINETKVVYAEAGTSLFALATNNNIAYNKLLEFNDLNKVDIINKAQLIFLQKKQKRGNKDIHIVAANENLYDICQKEGIQLSSILEFNNLQKNTTPTIGQRVLLKPQSAVSVKTFGDNRSMQTSAAMR